MFGLYSDAGIVSDISLAYDEVKRFSETLKMPPLEKEAIAIILLHAVHRVFEAEGYLIGDTLNIDPIAMPVLKMDEAGTLYIVKEDSDEKIFLPKIALPGLTSAIQSEMKIIEEERILSDQNQVFCRTHPSCFELTVTQITVITHYIHRHLGIVDERSPTVEDAINFFNHWNCVRQFKSGAMVFLGPGHDSVKPAARAVFMLLFFEHKIPVGDPRVTAIIPVLDDIETIFDFFNYLWKTDSEDLGVKKIDINKMLLQWILQHKTLGFEGLKRLRQSAGIPRFMLGQDKLTENSQMSGSYQEIVLDDEGDEEKSTASPRQRRVSPRTPSSQLLSALPPLSLTDTQKTTDECLALLQVEKSIPETEFLSLVIDYFSVLPPYQLIRGVVDTSFELGQFKQKILDFVPLIYRSDLAEDAAQIKIFVIELLKHFKIILKAPEPKNISEAIRYIEVGHHFKNKALNTPREAIKSCFLNLLQLISHGFLIPGYVWGQFNARRYGSYWRPVAPHYLVSDLKAPLESLASQLTLPVKKG